MLRDLLGNAVLSVAAVTVSSLWMGPKHGPVVRSVGWKVALVGAVTYAIVRAVV